MKGEPIVILLVEDDEAHAEIVRRNFERCRMVNRLMHVADGQAALDYLYQRNGFSDPAESPRPGIILLDLRLPKVDGLEVLKIIKADANLSRIPVVVLTTSNAETDKVKAYDSHASSYLVKPVDFAQFAELIRSFGYYWLAWNQFPD
ncbi:MAG: response regulator [Planctomycetota bacterium]|nr:response regulator [Planctomycetota bacterium]